MRLYEDALVDHGGPTAQVALAVLEEVDGPLELAGPAGSRDFAVVLIDDDDGAGMEDGVHRPIIEANQGVSVGA